MIRRHTRRMRRSALLACLLGLALIGGGSASGSFNIAPNTTLDFGGTGYTAGPSSSITGPGRVRPGLRQLIAHRVVPGSARGPAQHDHVVTQPQESPEPLRRLSRYF